MIAWQPNFVDGNARAWMYRERGCVEDCDKGVLCWCLVFSVWGMYVERCRIIRLSWNSPPFKSGRLNSASIGQVLHFHYYDLHNSFKHKNLLRSSYNVHLYSPQQLQACVLSLFCSVLFHFCRIERERERDSKLINEAPPPAGWESGTSVDVFEVTNCGGSRCADAIINNSAVPVRFTQQGRSIPLSYSWVLPLSHSTSHTRVTHYTTLHYTTLHYSYNYYCKKNSTSCNKSPQRKVYSMKLTNFSWSRSGWDVLWWR